MPDSPVRSRLRSAAWATLLAAFCLLVFAWGLNAQGLSNWQESQRALVAREMFRNNEWVVPTANGEPYIAKPPLMYWCEMAIAHARSALGFVPFSDESEVRLTVALAGLAGVLATFFVTRRMLGSDEGRSVSREWIAGSAALGLASGVLYVRASRTGAIDILLAPFTVITVGAIFACWTHGGLRRAGAIAIGTAAMAGAVLAKGPPALLAPLLALLGGPALWLISRADGPAPRRGAVWAGAAVGALALAGLSVPGVQRPLDWLGVLCFLLFGGALGAVVAALASSGQVGAWTGLVARAHPWFVFGVPLALLWVWGRLVAGAIGADALAALAQAELDDNLRLLEPGSPVSNLGFFAYGVLPMSIATIAALWWVLADRPRLSLAGWAVVAWVTLGLVAFSALGKGVARYLTPVWPACAMLGALWLGLLAARLGSGFRIAVPTALVIAGLGQAAWYGGLRPRYEGLRSPREMVAEVLAREPSAEWHAVGLACPALDFYADRRVEQWAAPGSRRGRDLAEFDAHADAASGRFVLLVPRRTSDGRKDGVDAVSFLRQSGLRVEPLPVRARFWWSSAGSEFEPVIVLPREPGPPAGLP